MVGSRYELHCQDLDAARKLLEKLEWLKKVHIRRNEKPRAKFSICSQKRFSEKQFNGFDKILQLNVWVNTLNNDDLFNTV